MHVSNLAELTRLEPTYLELEFSSGFRATTLNIPVPSAFERDAVELAVKLEEMMLGRARTARAHDPRDHPQRRRAPPLALPPRALDPTLPQLEPPGRDPMSRAAIALLLVSACAGPQATTPTEATRAGAASAPEIQGEEVTYEADGVTLKGYMAWDAATAAKRPGVLVVHEWWGHNEYARERARKLAALGYTALAVDMYGDGKQAEHPADAQKFMQAVMADMQVATARFLAARELLGNHVTTDERMAAIGYCFGGGVVLHMARFGLDLDAVASFHGSLATGAPAEAGKVKAKIFVANGEADPMVTPDQIQAFKDEMNAAGVDFRFVNYPGAKHAFTNPGATAKGEKFNLPLAYDANADAASWQAMQSFFAEVFE